MQHGEVSEQHLSSEESPSTITLVQSEIGGDVVELLGLENVQIIASRKVKNQLGDEITLTFYYIGVGVRNRNKYILSDGKEKQILGGHKGGNNISLVQKILVNGEISNQEIAEIYPSFIDTNGKYLGGSFPFIKLIVEVFQSFGVQICYDSSSLFFDKALQEESYIIKEYVIKKTDGTTAMIYLQDKGKDFSIKQRFSIGVEKSSLENIGGIHLHFIKFIEILLSGKILTYKNFEEYNLFEGGNISRIISRSKSILRHFGLDIINIKGLGYKIETGDVSETDLKTKTLSTKLQKNGLSLYLEESERGKDKQIRIESTAYSGSISLSYEQYVIFSEAIKSFGGRFGWKIDRQRKGELIETINELFVSSNIPLWINTIYADIRTHEGVKRVKSGEYELKIKE